MIRILMVSSYPLFSQGIETLLCHQVGLEIVGRETDFDRAAMIFVSAATLLSATKSGMVGTAKLT